MDTTEHAVVIAGGGPAGMMLAAELALAEVDVARARSSCSTNAGSPIGSVPRVSRITS